MCCRFICLSDIEQNTRLKALWQQQEGAEDSPSLQGEDHDAKAFNNQMQEVTLCQRLSIILGLALSDVVGCQWRQASDEGSGYVLRTHLQIDFAHFKASEQACKVLKSMDMDGLEEGVPIYKALLLSSTPQLGFGQGAVRQFLNDVIEVVNRCDLEGPPKHASWSGVSPRQPSETEEGLFTPRQIHVKCRDHGILVGSSQTSFCQGRNHHETKELLSLNKQLQPVALVYFKDRETQFLSTYLWPEAATETPSVPSVYTVTDEQTTLQWHFGWSLKFTYRNLLHLKAYIDSPGMACSSSRNNNAAEGVSDDLGSHKAGDNELPQQWSGIGRSETDIAIVKGELSHDEAILIDNEHRWRREQRAAQSNDCCKRFDLLAPPSGVFPYHQTMPETYSQSQFNSYMAFSCNASRDLKWIFGDKHKQKAQATKNLR